jgi:hypothetical protein
MISSENNFTHNYPNFESKPNVPKFNGSAPTPPPPINKATQRLKQDNRHEELRRRAR